MSAPQPFLSAGLPGLTFGLSLGRGLSIQLDPAGHVIGEKEEMNPEEDICYIKNVTLPTGMLVIHLYGLHELSIPDLTECILYVTFSIASTRKATSQKKYNIKTPTVLFNEIKMLPFVVNPKPVQQMNKIIVLVYACSPGEEHAVSKAKHRIVGRYEAHLHKLLKNITMKEVGCLLNKKGNIVGSIEFECCVTYGAFGYGQSYQNNYSSSKITTSNVRTVTKRSY
ncbi:uncharacterized protein LOC130621477 [Hydractinia symbiolongicarpus]|uniref:uncharacterized protein LOC130621477 n=1 Tax=Hydractinia symbiolongicarpus TaxID=13093 RepID=UPI00254C681D|nr:uncharacterized protein LOC130621477 [Hydractinia symbiolongicarpus]